MTIPQKPCYLVFVVSRTVTAIAKNARLFCAGAASSVAMRVSARPAKPSFKLGPGSGSVGKTFTKKKTANNSTGMKMASNAAPGHACSQCGTQVCAASAPVFLFTLVLCHVVYAACKSRSQLLCNVLCTSTSSVETAIGPAAIRCNTMHELAAMATHCHRILPCVASCWLRLTGNLCSVTSW